MTDALIVPRRTRIGLALALPVLLLSACAAQEETSATARSAMTTAEAADQDAKAALALAREARDKADAAERAAKGAQDETRQLRAELQALSEKVDRMFEAMQRK